MDRQRRVENSQAAFGVHSPRADLYGWCRKCVTALRTAYGNGCEEFFHLLNKRIVVVADSEERCIKCKLRRNRQSGARTTAVDRSFDEPTIPDQLGTLGVATSAGPYNGSDRYAQQKGDDLCTESDTIGDDASGEVFVSVDRNRMMFAYAKTLLFDTTERKIVVCSVYESWGEEYTPPRYLPYIGTTVAMKDVADVYASICGETRSLRSAEDSVCAGTANGSRFTYRKAKRRKATEEV